MNAFAEALRAYIQRGIDTKKWRSERHFTILAGTSTGTLSGYLGKDLHPAVETFRKWMEKVEADPADSERLITLLSREKAMEHEEMAPYVQVTERKLAESRAIIGRLVVMIKSGKPLHLTKDLEDSIEAL